MSASLLLSLALSGSAFAYEPPAFSPGQRLYLDVADDGFVHARSDEALAAAELRIFAVVSDDTRDPAHSRFDTQATGAIERTWEAWTRTPGFDASRDVLVFVSLDQRETRIKTGSVWDLQYGLHGEALTDVAERYFVQKAKAGDLDGALAATVTGMDETATGLAGIPALVPEPSGAGLFFWPVSTPPHPYIAAQQPFQVHSQGELALHVVYDLADGATVSDSARQVLPEGEFALAVVWDVFGQEVGVAGGPGWAEAELAWLRERLDQARNQDGAFTSARLRRALDDGRSHLEQLWRARQRQERVAWSFAAFAPEDEVLVHPDDLALGETRDVLETLSWPVRVTAVERADREGERRGPGGNRWIGWLRRDAEEVWGSDERDAVLVTIIGEPREIVVDAPARVSFEGHALSVDAMKARIDELPETLSIDEALAETLRRLDAQLEAGAARAVAAEQARKAVERGVTVGGVSLGAAAVSGVGLYAFFGWRRRRKLQFDLDLSERAAEVERARRRLDDFRLDAETRALVVALRDKGTRTTEVFEAVTTALDEVELGVRALERRLDTIRARAESAAWSPDPSVWNRLVEELHAPIVLEADPDDHDLFAPLVETREVEIFTFMDTLGERFATAHKGWRVLIDAANARFHRTEDDVGKGSLPSLRPRIEAWGLPASWFHAHPLFQEGGVVSQLDRLRQKDPVAYVRELARFREHIARFEARLELLSTELDERNAARQDALAALESTLLAVVVEPEHDPLIAREEAERLDAVADRRLKDAKDIDVAIAAMDEAADAWEEVTRRRAIIDDAIAHADDRVEQAEADLADAHDALDAHVRRLEGLKGVHEDIDVLMPHVGDAITDLSEAAEALERAQDALATDRVVAAVQAAAEVQTELAQHTEDVRALIDGMQVREKARTDALALLASLKGDRAVLKPRVRETGRHGRGALDKGDEELARLRRVVEDDTPDDWATLLVLARTARKSWRLGVQEAERKHRRAERLRVRQETATASAFETSRRSSPFESVLDVLTSIDADTDSSSSSSSSWGSSSSSSWGSSSRSSRRSRSGGSSWGSSSRSGGSSWSSSSSSGSSRSGGSSWSSSSSSGSSRSGGSSW